MKKFLMTLMILLAFSNVAGAVQLDGEGVDDLVQSVVYQPDDAEGSAYRIFDNRLEVVCSWNNILVANHKVKDEDISKISPNSFWYKDHENNKTYVLGVEGIVLQLRNLSNEALTIEWSESRFQLGDYFGLPFMNGMKYMDVGNPEKIPATVLQPGAVEEIHLWRGDPYIDFDWANGYAPVAADSSLRALISMKVTADKRLDYYTFKTPLIVLPQYAYESFLVE